MNFCRSQNKNNVCWWFFQCFEQSIESRCRQHMNFVYDVNTVFCHNRQIVNLVQHVTDIFNRVVGGSVHFSNIVDGFIFNTFAHITFQTRFAIYRMQAVYCFCKNFCAGCFTCTTCACKQKGVACFASGNLIFKGFYHIFLTDYLAECFRAVFSIQSYMHIRTSGF